MRRRIGWSAAWLVTLAVGSALVAGWLGWLSMPMALDLTMGAVALGGLWLVVWLPWDLYFAARRLGAEHEDSAERGIAVSPREVASAKRMAPRLLALAIGLHVGAAAIIAGVTYGSGGETGYYFAGFYLLAVMLRPIGALHAHLSRRLAELSSRARHPREDVLELRARLVELEATIEVEMPALREDNARLGAALERQTATQNARIAGFDGKVDSVLGELERSVARLTRDEELLGGIRAFVRVIREA